MARTLVAVLLLVGGIAVPSTWSQAATLYAANGAGGNPSNLVILDQNTGAVVSTVGPIGFAVTGLAVHPLTGVLYGSTASLDETASGSLLTISKTTGAGTVVGPIGRTIPDLAFTSDGTLYGWSRSPNALHRINVATGQPTRVGNFNLGTNFAGLGLAAASNGLVLGTAGNGPLFKVDPNTGVALPFTTTNWARINTAFGALAFGPGGILYGMGLAGSPGGGDLTVFLVRIDLPSGNVTELGPSVPFGDAIAFDPPVFPAVELPSPIPTLSELAFGVMALLLTAVAVYQIRRRRA